MNNVDVIEQDAKVLYDNNHLTPTDWADAWVLAERLDAAGLLARPLPTREEIAEVLKREFWPFLAHDPANPERFWGQSADAILALFLKGQNT